MRPTHKFNLINNREDGDTEMSMREFVMEYQQSQNKKLIQMFLFYLALIVIVVACFITLFFYYTFGTWYKFNGELRSSLNVLVDDKLTASRLIANSSQINHQTSLKIQSGELRGTNGNLDVYSNITMKDKNAIIFEDPYILYTEGTQFKACPFTRVSTGESVIQPCGITMDSDGNTFLTNLTLSSLNINNGSQSLTLDRVIRNTFTSSVAIFLNETVTLGNLAVTDTANIAGVVFHDTSMTLTGNLELVENSTIMAPRNGVRTSVYNHVAILVRQLTANLSQPIVRGNLTLVVGDISFGNNIYLSPTTDGIYIFTTPTVFGFFQNQAGFVGIKTNIPATALDVNGVTTSKGISNTGGLSNANGMSNSGGLTNYGGLTNNGGLTNSDGFTNLGDITNTGSIFTQNISASRIETTSLGSSTMTTGTLNISRDATVFGTLNTRVLTTNEIHIDGPFTPTSLSTAQLNVTDQVLIGGSLQCPLISTTYMNITQDLTVSGTLQATNFRTTTSTVQDLTVTGTIVSNSFRTGNSNVTGALTASGNVTITSGTLVLGTGASIQTLDQRIDQRIDRKSKIRYSGGYFVQSAAANVLTDVGGFVYKGRLADYNIRNMTLLFSMTNSAATMEFHVYDATSTKTIALVSNAPGTTAVRHIGLGVLNNIPMNESMIIYQIRRSAGSGNAIFYSLMLTME